MSEPPAIALVRYYMERASEHPALHQPTLELILSRLHELHRGAYIHEVSGLYTLAQEPLPPIPQRGSIRSAICQDGVWRIPLNKEGVYAQVDEEDAPFLTQWNWGLSQGYAVVKARGKSYLMHRVVASRYLDIQGFLVDHKDLDPLNNRRYNLRPATKAQNAQNRRATSRSTSGVKGVSPQGKRWRAQIRDIGGKTHYLGVYDTVDEAAEVYAEAAKRLHGEFGRTNSP